MTEIEQLRKEINELRERVARLEPLAMRNMQIGKNHDQLARDINGPFVWPRQADIHRNNEIQEWLSKNPPKCVAAQL